MKRNANGRIAKRGTTMVAATPLDALMLFVKIWATVAVLAARVAWAADPVPHLAAHVLLTQDESFGTAIATTPPITTQPSAARCSR